MDGDGPRPVRRLARHAAVSIAVGVAGFLLFGALAPGATTGRAAPRTGVHVVPVPVADASRFHALVAGRSGEPVVVNFWASWCGPCAEEASALAAASRRFGGRVRFVGVAVRDSSSGVRAFTEQYGIGYPMFLDPDGGLARQEGLFGLPVTRLYAADGSIIRQWLGPVPAVELARALRGSESTAGG